MIKYTLFILLIILSACGSNAPEPGLIFSANQLQLANEKQKDQGGYYYQEIYVQTFDYSNPFKVEKIKLVIDAANKIELESSHLNLQIEQLKTELFKELKENMYASSSQSIVIKSFTNKEPLTCSNYNLQKVKSTGSSNIITNSALKLQKAFQNYRREICKIIAEFDFYGKGINKYFFKDPNINQFKSIKELNKLIDIAVSTSNVYLEYRESLKELYCSLSHSDDFWKNQLSNNSSWVSNFSILLSLQNELFTARTLALKMLAYRIGHCCYSFSSIEPVVIGPEVARKNEDVYFDVFMAAFDQFQEPVVEIFGGGTLLYIKDGKARIKVNVLSASELTIKGKISIRKNSGDISVKNWEKTIIVLPEDENSKSIHTKTQKTRKY